MLTRMFGIHLTFSLLYIFEWKLAGFFFSFCKRQNSKAEVFRSRLPSGVQFVQPCYNHVVPWSHHFFEMLECWFTNQVVVCNVSYQMCHMTNNRVAQIIGSIFAAGIYLLKVRNENSRTMYEMFSKCFYLFKVKKIPQRKMIRWLAWLKQNCFFVDWFYYNLIILISNAKSFTKI